MYCKRRWIAIRLCLRRCLETGRFPLWNERGFSLAESLVAVALLGTVMLSLVGALSTGSLAVKATRETVVEQSLAQSQLAYTKSYPFDSGTATYPTVDIYDATNNPNPVTLPGGYSISVAVTDTQDADSNIQKITATITLGGTTVMVAEDFKVNR